MMAIGDMASVHDADGKAIPLPGVAPVAMQQGRYAAKAIRGRLEGREPKPFHYTDKGNLATIGRAKAVADIKGLQLSGIIAWLTWLFVHLFYLIGLQNRLIVFIRWTWSFISHGRGARLITTQVGTPAEPAPGARGAPRRGAGRLADRSHAVLRDSEDTCRPGSRSIGVDVQTNEAERRRWNDERWAALWPKREPMTDAVSPYVLEAAALSPGEDVLEIGSRRRAPLARRQRAPSDPKARSSAPTCRHRSERCRPTRAQRGRRRERLVPDRRHADRHRLRAGPFDVALSQFGVMFFDDPVRAFGNIRSQLVRGGRIAFACWQRLEDNRWHFASAISEFLPPPAPSPAGAVAPGPFSLADPKRTDGDPARGPASSTSRRTPHELLVDVPAGLGLRRHPALADGRSRPSITTRPTPPSSATCGSSRWLRM